MREIRSPLIRYGLALGSFGLILSLSFLIERVFPFRVDLTSMIIIAMIASSWYLGLGPGLLLAVILEITLIYFGKPPLAVRTFVITFNRLVLFGSVVWFASSRRKAEQKLREQSELLQVTLSSIGDAVIATDVNGRVTFLNPTAQSITGWSFQDASGENLDKVFHVLSEDTGEPVESPFAAIKREGVIIGLANHRVLITKSGQRIPIEDSGAPIRDTSGKLQGAVIVFHDVTERRRAEKERDDLLQREHAARRPAPPFASRGRADRRLSSRAPFRRAWRRIRLSLCDAR